MFWFGTLAGGMSLTWVRLGICAAHMAGAVGCAILCTRWTGSKLAGLFAGTSVCGAHWGSSMNKSGGRRARIFCLGMAFFILALVALDRDAKNPELALAVSVLMLLLAALGMNGSW